MIETLLLEITVFLFQIDWYKRNKEPTQKNKFWKDEHTIEHKQTTICNDCERLQKQFGSIHAELLHLRHGNSRLKIVLSEKGSELSNAVRRAEKCEREVRRWKLRMEEKDTIKQGMEFKKCNKELKTASNHEIKENIADYRTPVISGLIMISKNEGGVIDKTNNDTKVSEFDTIVSEVSELSNDNAKNTSAGK